MDVPYQNANDNHRSRAISKLRMELEKDIAGAVSLAQSCGLWDLLRLLYEFRLARSLMISQETRDQLSPGDIAGFHLNDEGMKYAISLVGKHGQWNEITELDLPLRNFDISRVHKLEKLTRYINAKFETEILLNIADVTVTGERDEHCAINIQAGLLDPKRAMHLQFGLRLESFTSDQKDDALSIPALIERFQSEYSSLSELFADDNGISMDEYCEGVLSLHDALVARSKAAEVDFVDGDKELVNVFSRDTFINLSLSLVMTDAELNESFKPGFVAYIRRNKFDPAAISDSELRYHYASRRPFLIGEGFVVFSPELVFDSVLGNARYTFLESTKSKQKFMAISASHFIDKISRVAAVAGYQEVGRDIYLKEGKKDIGDIDLFLWNPETDHSLLIEAKNHTLPLPVYFRSPEAVENHISRNRDWESKVQRRIAHLHGAEASFHVFGSWDYLVVSLMPEPLSHVTDLLVLSLGEFERWLSIKPPVSSFTQLHEIIHDGSLANYSSEDMLRMHQEGFSLFNPYAE